MNLTREVHALVSAFTAELARLAKRQAGSKPSGVHTPRPAGQSRPRNGKRAPDQLGEMKRSILDYVASHPGLRTEQINAALGTSTKELALPIRQLVAAGALRTEGQRRGTKYHAVSKAKQARRTATPRARAA